MGMPMITGTTTAIIITATTTTMIRVTFELVHYPRRRLGLLPPPLAGEGWGGGDQAHRFCVPAPYPSLASGGGDAVAPAVEITRLRGAAFRR